MSATFKHRVLVWLWNGINALLNGLAGGVLVALGVNGTNAISPDTVAKVTPHQFVIICIVSGLVGLANYIRTPEGKLPPIDSTDGKIEVK